MPKISVVIPVYNVEDYLAKCVESVLAQDFQDYEVILVNDGSTDGSLKIAQEYERNHDKVRLISQQNKGLGGARNTGIENACGEYICFFDSDDYIAPNTLSVISKTIDEENSDIIVFDIEYVDEDGHTLSIQKVFPGDGCTFRLSEKKDFLFASPSACNKVFRTCLFAESGVRFPSRVWFEDIRTTLKLYPYADKITYIPQAFYKYLQRSDSIMHSSNLDRNSEIMDALDDVLSYYKEHGLYDQYRAELDFAVISNVFVLASFRVFRQDSKHPLLEQFHQFLMERAPEYRSNPYVQVRLKKKEIIIYKLLLKRSYVLLALLIHIQDLLRNLKRGGNN